MLNINDKSQNLYELITQAYDAEVLSKEQIDLAHIIRKQRNIAAHQNENQRNLAARTLLTLFAAALLWPDLSRHQEDQRSE